MGRAGLFNGEITVKGERVFIIIDGNNFYHRLKELRFTNLLNFDYGKLEEFLITKRQVVLKKYYIGAIREERGNRKSRKLMRNQRILTGKLQRVGWKIGFGQMLKTDEGYHEKGVDVLMAVDLLVGAYENLYDTAILISSDTDLLPAMDKVRHLKKQIEYVGFGHTPSFAMQAHASISRLIVKSDIISFFSKLSKKYK